ncbi:MAG: hypothetical protein U0930_14370 [Pirellulales bacterium]
MLGTTGVTLPHRSWFLYRKHIVLPPLVVKPSSQIQSEMSYQAGGILKPSQAGETFANVEINVEPFLIDRHEVLIDDLLEVLEGLHRLDEDEIDGIAVKVTFEHALAYAEKTGKQLQTAWQWLFACSNGGVSKFPWGSNVNSQPWPLVDKSDQFDNKSEPPVSGLYSRVLEWADTTPPQLPKNVMDQLGESPYKIEPLRLRAIVGGPLDFAVSKELRLAKANNPMLFAYEATTNFYSNVGIRCTRNLKSKG